MAAHGIDIPGSTVSDTLECQQYLHTIFRLRNKTMYTYYCHFHCVDIFVINCMDDFFLFQLLPACFQPLSDVGNASSRETGFQENKVK